MSGFWDDLRFGLRMLRKSPGFTAVAVVVLGLGIGANTAIFSFLNALLLRPFPFENLHALVTLWEAHPQQGGQPDVRSNLGHRNPVPAADFLDWRNNQAFEQFAAFRYRELNLSGRNEPESVRGALVTPNFFPMLRVKPMLGRTFLPEEETPGRDGAVLLSHALWKDRFGSDPDILGKTCTLNGRTVTVVGVMPSDFDFPLGGVRLWQPLALTAAEMSERGAAATAPTSSTWSGRLLVLARLRNGVSLRQAQAEMDGIAARLAQQYPQTNSGRRVTLVPLSEVQVGIMAPFAMLFQAAAGFVLLIACANLATLLLARATGRQKEVAVRAALGASRRRIMRQLLIEGLVLSLLGGVFALWLAQSCVDMIRASVPYDIVKWLAGWSAIQLDGRVLAFTLGVAVLTSLAFGFAPARQASRVQLTELLKEGSRGSAPRGRHRLRSLPVVAELALALVLLVGAGLMVRGFLGGMNVHQGFDSEGVMTLRVVLPQERYPKPQVAQFYQTLLERLEALPEVQSAAVVSQLPADLGPMPGGGFSIEGRPVLSRSDLPVVDFQSISPDYFRTLHIPILRGRAFGDQDGLDAPSVAIISDSTARRFWAGEDPLGKRIRVGAADADGPWMLIVGVAADVKQYWFEREPRPTLYFPHLQALRGGMWVLIRTSGDADGVAAAGRAQVSSLDKDVPVLEVQTLAEVIRQSMAFIRMSAVLMLILGGVAVLLSASGVYGVMAYHVSQRTHEIGIRLAVGARQPEISRLVVTQALKLTALALVIGLPLAVVLSRLMSGLLFGVVQPDVMGLVGTMLGLTSVALIASYLPARKAAGVDPVVALRGE